MFRSTAIALTGVALAYLATLTAPPRAPERTITSLSLAPSLAQLYSGGWEDEPQDAEPLWCDSAADPRCAPAAPGGSPLGWSSAPAPVDYGAPAHAQPHPLESDGAGYSDVSGLGPARGSRGRVERPPRA